MAALGTKVVVLMMVLPSLLLLLQTSSVEAVDLVAYNKNGKCSGKEDGGCYSVQAGLCCVYNGAAAVKVVNLLKGESATLYTGGGCKKAVAHLKGPNAGECYYNYAFSGALWKYST